jgi:ATP-binding cassette subfamily C protein LapB
LSQAPEFDADALPPQATEPELSAAVPEPGQGDDATDPLLDALLWLCKHHGQERTASSLLGDVGHETAITPTQAVRVMRDAGFNAALVKRAPQQILGLLFPVVLLLKQGEACVLIKRLGDGARGQADERYEVLMPSDGQTVQASAQDLMAEYTGYALVVSPKVNTAPVDDEVGTDPDQHWLWGTLRRFVPYYRSAMMAAMLSNVLMLVTGLFSSVVFDRVIPHKAMVTLWSLALGTFVAIGFDLLARQLRSHLIDLAGKKADLMLGNLLFKQALNMRLEHRPASSGSFAHQLAQIEVVRDFSTSATLSALTDLPFVFLFIAMVFVTAGPLGWVLVAAVPLMLGMSWFIQGVLGRLMTANVKQHAELQGVLVEAVEGIEDVRSAGATGFFLRRYEEANAASAQSGLRARAMSSWVNNAAMVSQQLVTVTMLLWGVHLIHDGVLTGGALIGAVMFAGRAVAPLSSVVSLATRYQGAKAALRTLDRIMRLPTDREPGRPYLPQTRLKGKLSLKDVTFSYPTGVHEHAPLVLREVTLNIQPGQRVAILGKMGSGKSTILRLLGGLYQPSEGMVEVDGIDLRQVDPVDFRSHIGFVSQEPRLFTGTLRDNILMGRAHADPRLLVPVLQLTGLDKVAGAHPLGLDMQVGESGALLSGGQRQLVALARCLVTQPQVLLLDEPTSSLDAQAEANFVKHLGSVTGQRTLVLVTHRPALLDVVDHVVVMEAGRVVASGPKAQVLAALAGKPMPAQAAPPAAPAPVSQPEPMAVPDLSIPDLKVSSG